MLPSPISSPRGAFIDQTNVERELPVSPTRSRVSKTSIPTPTSQRHIKRQRLFPGKGVEPAFKRQRLFKALSDIDSDSSDDESSQAGPSTAPVRHAVFAMRSATARGPRPLATHRTLPTDSLLSSFVSSHKSDGFRIHSDHDNGVTPPYACHFSNASKCGSASHLAVATEQGTVHILDVSARKDWDPEPPRTVIRPHENGVFDVRWSPSDDRLATCSADRTAIISDPRRPDVPALNILHGHEDTLKCVAWQTENILATGDRGGKIKLWDLRVQPHSNNQLESVATMVQKPLPMIKARKARLGAAPARSITGLLFAEAQQSSYMIIGSTSTNGHLQAWDLRKPQADKDKWLGVTQPAFTSREDPTTHGGAHRARGLNGITQGHGPTAGLLFAAGWDSRIHVYSSDTLQPLTTMSTNLWHPNFKGTSFYARTSLSPCGQWLASGSAGLGGHAFMFDVAGMGSALARGEQFSARPVHLQGHIGEVGAPDWAHDALATCADDGTVRMWRPNVEAYRRCQREPSDARWDWSWGTTEES